MSYDLTEISAAVPIDISKLYFLEFWGREEIVVCADYNRTEKP